MRIYDPADEEKIRTTALVREWTRSGLLDAAQAAAIEPELKTNLRQTGRALRSALAVVGVMIIGAALGLWMVASNARSDEAFGAACLVFGVLSIGGAEFLIHSSSFYRFGVEEACAAAAVVLFVVGAVILFDGFWNEPVIGLVVGMVASAAVYLRYGPWYALFTAAGCLVVLPSTWEIDALVKQVLMASAALLVFIAAGRLRAAAEEDFNRDDFEWLEAAAFAAFYFFIHLRLNSFVYDVIARPAVLWNSYALIWLVPVIGLFIGFRARLPWMIRVGGALFIVTLVTHKEFLGWPTHDWDPIVLGVFLCAVAIFLRRYLAAGENGARDGYTATRILLSDKANRSLVGTFGGLKQQGPVAASPAPGPDPYTPGGGASGGAGAAGKF